MGRVVSEKGFKESVIFDEIIRRDEWSEKPWHVYFEYGIRGDKWSKVKKGDYETEEEAKRMLEEFIRSFEEEKDRVDKHVKEINTLTWMILIVAGITILEMLGVI